MVDSLPGVPLTGYVDDTEGNQVVVGAAGTQVAIGWNAGDYRLFDPRQIAELIDYLTNARLDALLAESMATANCGECSHLWKLHGLGGCGAKIYPSSSLTGEPCPCQQNRSDDE